MARRRRKSGKRKSSGAAGFLLGMFLMAALAAGAAAAWVVLTPYGPETETFVNVTPGSSAIRIGRQLEAAGVVRSRYAFDMVRWFRQSKLQAGTYRFDHPAPVTEVYERIARGDVFTKSLTVPEGANVFDIAARVEQAGLGTRESFLDAATNETNLVADLDPGAKSLEGYLFPDTYRFSPTVTAAQIVAAMVQRFRAAAGQLGLKENVHKVVTIASLVERETAVDSERPLVASVFENRLAKGMPLRTDPAVIYGLELTGRWRGTIYESDLTRDTPYNTYLHAGLPPGPVANPGIPSLRAAMDPPKTNYFYFVAAGTNAQGHSLFAETLDEHNRNVARYRKAHKKAGER
ncbi:MAG: endolytic transglycosylase MltG [Terracidiphilus sp.]